MSFSNDIKSVRKRAMLSQEEFAQALGVSFTTVNRWEAGKCMPSYKAKRNIQEYCNANNIEFDVSKDWMEEHK